MMDKKQVEHLRSRLNDARKSKREWQEDKKPEPDRVTKARGVVKVWEEERRAASEKRRTAIARAAREVEEAILFGVEEEALGAVKRFEDAEF